MEQFSTVQWLVFSAVWLVGSFGSAALLALLYKKLHPDLSFHKLWAFWVLIVSVIGAAVLQFV